jgi:hypothetical protein
MTSIQFHIDPTALRILHGDRAEGFQRRRERDRDRERVRDAYGLAMRGDDVEAVLRQRDAVAPAREGLRMYNDQMMRERMGNNGGPAAAGGGGGGRMQIAGAAAQFMAVGGRRLNLDK